VVSVLDPGAVGPGFISQPRLCRVTGFCWCEQRAWTVAVTTVVMWRECVRMTRTCAVLCEHSTTTATWTCHWPSWTQSSHSETPSASTVSHTERDVYLRKVRLREGELSIKATADTIHTHPFNGPLSGTTWVIPYQKGKANLDFTEARDSEWHWQQLGHIQVCTSLQTDNHASIPPLSFYRLDALPVTQPTASKHWSLYSNNQIMKYILEVTKTTFNLGKIRKKRKIVWL